MRLNTLSPSSGSRISKKRVGRGIGSGRGKTCGRGHKGLKSRSGGSIRPGFEGGQMPLQKRLPKFGFTSRIASVTAEVRLSELNKVNAGLIDLSVLQNSSLVNKNIKHVKIFLSGKLTKAVSIKGLRVSKGARIAIESVGGKVEE